MRHLDNTYEVFLSFRGLDTRNNFTSHLYSLLNKSANIITFIDSNMPRGDNISSFLFQAIETSWVATVVPSPNFAFSTWCLDEVVKILECKHSRVQLVLPVSSMLIPQTSRNNLNSASIPLEIIIEILSWLPVKTLMRLRCVCKSWKGLISDACFIRKHLVRMSSFKYASCHYVLFTNHDSTCLEAMALDSVLGFKDFNFSACPPRSILQLDETLFVDGRLQPIGSCNGLVLVMALNREKKLILWNPSTRESKILPDLVLHKSPRCLSNLGYDSISNDYKVLTVLPVSSMLIPWTSRNNLNSASIPLEIIIEILSWLPVKTLMRLRCVCKSWKHLISDACFIRKHLVHMSSFKDASCHYVLFTNHDSTRLEAMALDSVLGFKDFNFSACPPRSFLQLDETFFVDRRLQPIGSCNGLVLVMALSREKKLILWNPSTRESKILPDPVLHKSPRCLSNLGYDSISNDYKVLMVSEKQAALYSLSENSWRRVSDSPYELKPYAALPFCGNAFIWIIFEENECWQKFVSFDLAEESFQVHSLPVPVPSNKNLPMPSFELGVLGGDLCATYSFESHVDMWVMKELGVKESWIKIHTIHTTIQSYPRSLFMCGDEIVLVDGRGIIIYNKKKGATKGVVVEDSSVHVAHIYMESLVSPNSK